MDFPKLGIPFQGIMTMIVFWGYNNVPVFRETTKWTTEYLAAVLLVGPQHLHDAVGITFLDHVMSGSWI